MSAFRWTGAAVAEALGVSPSGPVPEAFTGVSTDTRKVQAGELFVALAGESYDAHDFLGAAHAAGAVAAVVSRIPGDVPEGLALYRVDNTLHALGRLGRHRRRAFAGRVIAVAGSNGKTTTKEMVRAALAGRFRVHATEGNLNNQVGTPLTLLALSDDAEVAVIEVGTNEPGEIAILGAIAEPNHALITSIGEEHLEGLGSIAGVLDEELSILPAIRAGGVALIADEPDELVSRAAEMLGSDRVRVAGLGPAAALRPDGAVAVRPDGSTEWSFRGQAVHVPLPGMHNVRNALLALGVATELGVSPALASAGIGAMRAPRMRNEWRRVGEIGLIADCYNANPPSMRAAVELLASIPSEGERVAVVGTMRELGDHAAALHRAAAEHIASLVGRGIDRVLATGDFVPAFRALQGTGVSDRLVLAEDPLEGYALLRPHLTGSETILLKGSRGVALERLIPLLEEDFGGERSASHTHAGA